MDDRKEFDKLIEAYYRQSFKHLVNSLVARTRSVHNAEDVVQEAFTRALTFWKTFDPNFFSFDAWFKGILENSARTHNNNERMRGMSVNVDDEILHTFNPNPYFTQFLSEIEADVNALPDDKRYIISLNLFKQMTPNDISQVVNLSPGAIKILVYRFKEGLKEKYGSSIYG